MSHNLARTHPAAATQLAALELISNTLAVAHPQELGRKLTEELRELTGARTVLMIARRAGAQARDLLHACPERRATLFQPEELRLFWPDRTPDPLPASAAELPPDHPLRAPLSRAGVESLLRFPLHGGGELLGVLLLLDLPALERTDEASQIITLLCPPISLALRNALAFEQIERQRREIQQHAGALEERVKERTTELAAANADLLGARVAALNMMEDAVAARQRAEEVNVALRHEVEERRRAEEEIRKLNQELDRRVKERTAELERVGDELKENQRALMNIVEDLNDKTASLEAANEKLEAVNKELEAFSYSVSHDLRAPLRGMDGFSQALLEDYGGKLDEEGRHYLRRIRFGSQRMAQLIDDMLNLSRVTRGDLRKEEVNLSKLAQKVAGDLAQGEPQRRVNAVIAPNLVATGDFRLLQVVLENLLGNAWKFTGKQPGARIEFGRMMHSGVFAYFVRDNGVGFDMAYAQRLFGAFQRLHSTEEFPGTGIGLATVQRIIHRHGGRIWAESRVGEGATFFFALP